MSSPNNELSGALFKNDKGGNQARPDYRGRCTINGVEYRMSAWIRTARTTGAKYMSLAFTPPEANDGAPTADMAGATANAAPPTDDPDIPF